MRMLIAGLALVALAGCAGSAENAARSTLATAAHVVSAVDLASSRAMASTRSQALENANSSEEFIGQRMPFYRVEESIRGARELLYATERGIDAAGADALESAAPCIVAALLRLRALVAAVASIPGVDIEVPQTIDSVLAFLRPFGGTCEGGEVTQ